MQAEEFGWRTVEVKEELEDLWPEGEEEPPKRLMAAIAEYVVFRTQIYEHERGGITRRGVGITTARGDAAAIQAYYVNIGRKKMKVLTNGTLVREVLKGAAVIRHDGGGKPAPPAMRDLVEAAVDELKGGSEEKRWKATIMRVIREWAFRVGEVIKGTGGTKETADPEDPKSIIDMFAKKEIKYVRKCDVQPKPEGTKWVDATAVSITLCGSKNDQLHQGSTRTMRVEKEDGGNAAWHLKRLYEEMSEEERRSQEPLNQKKGGGRWWTYKALSEAVKGGARKLGLENWRDYRTHSLRRGGIQERFEAAGQDFHAARHWGRWIGDSRTVFSYARLSWKGEVELFRAGSRGAAKVSTRAAFAAYADLY